ncbi:hypothetical protein ACE38V_09530 [Cytobacillus sp. Hz8]|uniref:hypothetical protein n=1 Tax=Cytobacillus sp. Hz8 TaxID=3347168 RepID=UPI0035DAECE6
MNKKNGDKGNIGELWLGIIISVAIYLVAFGLLFSAISFFGIVLALIAYIVSITLAFVKGKTRLGQGMLIGAGVVFLINAACFGYIFTSL